MRFLKIPAIFILCTILGITSYAQSYSVEDFDIGNIEISEDYMICTQKSCDEDFKTLLTANGYGFTSWVNDVMKPNNYYIYAMNNKNQCIYVACEKNEIQEIVLEKDGSKTHPLMSDYNMLQSADDKTEVLNSTKDSLVLQGVSAGDITTLRWADLETETPYLEYMCSVNSQYLHCYEAIYNASKITFQFTSPKAFSADEIQTHADMIKNLEYGEKPDYTEARNMVQENLQSKLEEETHSGENTRILRYILSVSIALVIVFALIMAIKTQSKKRRHTVAVNNDDADYDEEK